MGRDFWKAPPDSIILESRPLLSRTCLLTLAGVRWRNDTTGTGKRKNTDFLSERSWCKRRLIIDVTILETRLRRIVLFFPLLFVPPSDSAQPHLTKPHTFLFLLFLRKKRILYSNTSPVCSTSTRRENLTERPGLRLKNIPPHLSWLLILSYLRMSNPFYLSPLLYLFMSLFIFHGDVTESIALTWIGGCYLAAEVYSAVTLIHPSVTEASLYTWFIFLDIYRHPGANHWYWFSIPWVCDILRAAEEKIAV